MTAARDHYLTTDDFTEVRENFVRGMRKYLVMGEDTGPGGVQATDCGDMFAEFFSVIATRPDYTLDWPSYRGYIIESYTSWVGRRDDSYGLIFDEHLFYKHKMSNLVPVLLEQLRQPASGSGSLIHARGSAGLRGRGRGFQTAYTSTSNRGGYQPTGATNSFLGQTQTSTTSKCYLCGGQYFHRDHQGTAVRLAINEQGKWVDKQLGGKIVCISFNVNSAGCRRGTGCSYSHSCSLCGDLSHGSSKCAV
jgi:hypothetical protein